jgi:hypothetical protein
MPAAVGSFSSEASGNSANEDQGAEELASMVWRFVGATGSLVQELDTEVECDHFADANQHSGLTSCKDEVKLLRLRTKKQEFVIVPDTKYLLVVVHDTSSA